MLFSKVCGCTRQQAMTYTLFNFTAKSDLQVAFDSLNNLLSCRDKRDQENAFCKPLVVRSTLLEGNNNTDSFSLTITPIWGDDEKTLKYLCASLTLKNSASLTTGKATTGANMVPGNNVKAPAMGNEEPLFTSG
jgi:hypothetical protein